jgi:hypothetical protein
MVTIWEWIDVTDEPYDEEHFLNDFWYYYRVPGNILRRYELTVDKLRQLPTYDDHPSDTSILFGYKLEPGSPWEPEKAVHTVYHRGDAYEEAVAFPCWLSLLQIRNFGEQSLLYLVNYLRNHKIELPWFEQFDHWTQNWTKYEGRFRVPKVETTSTS